MTGNKWIIGILGTRHLSGRHEHIKRADGGIIQPRQDHVVARTSRFTSFQLATAVLCHGPPSKNRKGTF